MSAGQNGNRLWQRVAVYLGLVHEERSVPRSRLARVLDLREDCSRREGVTSVVISVLLLALVAPGVFQDPAWFRPVAALASLVLLAGLVQKVLWVRRRDHDRQ